MKKFFAIVLGLTMVFAVASIASADFSTEGRLRIQWIADTDATPDPTYGSVWHGDTAFKLKLSKSWDNVSASFTLAYDEQSDTDTDFCIDGYELAYKFSDAFTLKAARSFEVKTPIWDSGSIAASIPYSAPTGVANVTKGDRLALIGEYTLDGGYVKAATNLDFAKDQTDMAFAAEYTFEPVTIGGVVDNNASEDALDYALWVKYAVTDEILVTLDYYFEAERTATLTAEDSRVAIKAAYTADPFTAAVQIRYDFDPATGIDEFYYYKLEGSYMATDALKLSANFGDDQYTTYDGETTFYELKAAYTINEGPVVSVAYNNKADLTVELDIKF